MAQLKQVASYSVTEILGVSAPMQLHKFHTSCEQLRRIPPAQLQLVSIVGPFFEAWELLAGTVVDIATRNAWAAPICPPQAQPQPQFLAAAPQQLGRPAPMPPMLPQQQAFAAAPLRAGAHRGKGGHGRNAMANHQVCFGWNGTSCANGPNCPRASLHRWGVPTNRDR